MTKRTAHVQQMFGSIASRYDLANHVLSCGIDFYWRRRAAEMAATWQPHHLADLGTGTGDLALALQRRLPHAEVTGVDFVSEMLELARRKGVRQTVLADAMSLPFAAASFDCVTIAFGLRNLPDWAGALAEMSRVLKTSGHLLVLEFSLPASALVRAIYRLYLHWCVPLLGSALTGRKSAYAYLGDSIEEFPSGAAMCHLITQSGFTRATFQPLTAGIVALYTATKE